jgi:hypothetical protein
MGQHATIYYNRFTSNGVIDDLTGELVIGRTLCADQAYYRTTYGTLVVNDDR